MEAILDKKKRNSAANIRIGFNGKFNWSLTLNVDLVVSVDSGGWKSSERRSSSTVNDYDEPGYKMR